MKVAKKRYTFVLVILLILTGAAVGYAVWSNSSDPRLGPGDTKESSFLLNDMYYDCSRPIAGRWVEANVGPTGESGHYFQPSHQEEFEKYCRRGAVIEYRAVLDILGRDDIGQLIDTYSTTEAWVRALGHEYIQDKEYLNRILPAYKNMRIDCIIVVHSPEATRFFIENGEHESHDDHQYLEVPASEFLASLNQAPDSDVTSFWLGLR